MNAMRSFAVGVGGLLVLTMGSLCWGAGSDGPQSVDEAWVKAMKANDLNAVVACYAPDAVGWFPGENQAKGTDAIRAVFKRLLDANTVTDAKLADTTYKSVGDRAVAWGTFTLKLTPKAGGAPVVMAGRFTAVMELRDGKWVYVVDHASADPAPGEGAGK